MTCTKCECLLCNRYFLISPVRTWQSIVGCFGLKITNGKDELEDDVGETIGADAVAVGIDIEETRETHETEE